MKYTTIFFAVIFSSAFNAYAVDTADVENITMRVLESGDEIPEAAMRELSLPEQAVDTSVGHAQQREGFGLSRANEVRSTIRERSGDDAQEAANDAAERAAENAADAAEQAAENAADAAEQAAENAADAAEKAAEAAEQAADNASNRGPNG